MGAKKLYSKGKYRGYHLCVDDSRYWIGDDLRESKSNFPKAKKKYLKNKDFKILYYFGPDEDGNPDWAFQDSAQYIKY